jgi:hypothetical protein
VTLAESGNDFGSVRATATAGGVTLFDAGDILLGTPGQADSAGVSGGNYVVTALGTITVSAGHGIDSTGNSAVSLTAARNIVLANGSSITTVDGGITLQANQQATPASGNFVGIDVNGAAITSTGAGEVKLHGTGGDEGTNNHGVQVSSSGVITSAGPTASVIVKGSGGGGNGERNFGVYVGAGRLSSGGAGMVSVTGVGGPGLGGDNHGVFVTIGEITSGGGDVVISGQGSENTESTLRSYGVEVGGSLISAGGLGNVTITGVGGAGLAQRNYGVYVRSIAVITSNGGDVSVWGQGGDGDSSLNYGVMTTGDAEITSGGSGNVAVTGIGGKGAGSNNVGLYVSPSTITSGGSGTVTVLGQGGGNSDSGGGNRGILMSSGVITSGGIGQVTVSGFGGTGPVGNNDGIFFLPGTVNGVNSGDTVRITSGGGDVNVLGHAGEGPTNLKRGIDLGGGSGGGMIASGNNADITITTDGLWVGSTAEVAIDSGAGKTTLRPYSSGTLINLGGASSAATNPPILGFTAAVMEKFVAGTLVIGDTDSGTLSVTADITRTATTNMQLISGGDIVISGGSIDTGGGTLSLHAGDSPAAIRPTRSGSDVTATTLALANDLAIVIDGTAVDVDYTQLSVVGTVDLTGVDLDLTGSYYPVEGDEFTIVSATAVDGQFNGLADGDQVMLGGQSLTIHYSSTAVTLIVLHATPTITIDWTGGTYNGTEFVATGSATGVNGETLAGLDLGASFTNVPGGTANWVFTDVTGNYNDSGGSVAIEINQRSITVTADDQTKVYGDADPALTHGITSGSLVATDAFFGELARVPGENVGSYAIMQGSLALSDNYDLSFVDAELEITHAILTGDATTQDALNMAKQGLLEITVTNIEGFVNGENSDVFLSSATFWITIEGTKYEFEPTSVTKLSDTSISISYKLKNSDLRDDLAEALEFATSGATALEAGFSMESMNYSLSDDYLTRLFSTVK